MKLIEPVLNWIHAKRWKLTSDILSREKMPLRTNYTFIGTYIYRCCVLVLADDLYFIWFCRFIIQCTGILLHLPSHFRNPPEFIEFFRCIISAKRCRFQFILYANWCCDLQCGARPRERELCMIVSSIVSISKAFCWDTFPFIRSNSSSYDDFHQWYANFFLSYTSLNSLTLYFIGIACLLTVFECRLCETIEFTSINAEGN